MKSPIQFESGVLAGAMKPATHRILEAASKRESVASLCVGRDIRPALISICPVPVLADKARESTTLAMPMEYYAGTLAAEQNFHAYRTMHIHLGNIRPAFGSGQG